MQRDWIHGKPEMEWTHTTERERKREGGGIIQQANNTTDAGYNKKSQHSFYFCEGNEKVAGI